ncbi:type VI secretion system accessory protein TagJ [Cognatazoarcus halotolerans]|uniref:type VI secretion system accessory protein TagJ n=1 Tax=Cognatazoarcus halotolerans TaxID=2686016 RepID=UPI0013570545|nr:type VI secretion system accessory protein TagJ [Cognatazoarcus halotolerans]MBX3679378.1 tetratricopeptide repeat protein [Rhodocyclaceae bacterium]MCB1899687.1 tetratricopeptide repeat protein [Rhodocyclaceae bacterium]MCP5309332.1 tetratricopeptide repeat protein [Zoogloeaceae bacterium]
MSVTAKNVADAEASLRAGDPEAALSHLQAAIRSQPADSRLRVFLFQLLSVLGQWERALNQLNVATELDASTLAMAQMYRETLRCEALRTEVFAGKRVPLLFGEPEQWLALLLESLLSSGRGDTAAAVRLREQAFDLAPPSSGRLDGTPFAWLADADTRLGPVCEAVINGRYYWLPFSRLASIDIEAPADLRDFVWAPAHFLFANGGEAVGVIPTRYSGSETVPDGAIRLARRTEWIEHGGDYHGLGQRLLTTDEGEFPLLDIRRIEFDPAASTEEADG